MADHPLFEAWEHIHCRELPGDMRPEMVARMLLHSPEFPRSIDGELFIRCADEVEKGGMDFYSPQVIEGMSYLAAYHLHGQAD